MPSLSAIGLPRDVSLHGELIDAVLRRSHWFELAMFVFMAGWLILAMVRFRRAGKAVYDHGDSPRKKWATLGFVAFVFLTADGSLLYSSIRGVDDTFWNWSIPAKDPNTVRVEVNGHQWAWDFRLAGDDGEFNNADDIVGWNELVVPVDTPVHLQLTSSDVVHGFYLPNFRVKTDVVPGTVHQLWFGAKETGEFEIGCTQHCGTHHYKMKAKLRVVTKEQFAGWKREASKVAKLGFDADDLGARWGWPWRERE